MKRAGWLAALLLLVVVNAVVLAGVSWNRSGDADAALQLTERELPLHYRVSRSRENTGVALRLNLHFESYAPHWLDAAKLRELGFPVPDSGVLPGDDSEQWKRPVPRRAWVVLEYDGPAWQAALDRKQRRLEELRRELEEGKATRKQVAAREKALARMQQGGSRLVAVDAGLDAAALRARYADADRYIITAAKVRVWLGRSQPPEEEGERLSVEGRLHLLVNRIHVPLAQHARLLAALDGEFDSDRDDDADQTPRYAVRLRYGKRYEPWLEEIFVIE